MLAEGGRHMEVCRQPRAMHRALITNHTSEVVRVEATGPLSDVAQFLLDLACKKFTEDLGATPVHINDMDDIYSICKRSGLHFGLAVASLDG